MLPFAEMPGLQTQYDSIIIVVIVVDAVVAVVAAAVVAIVAAAVVAIVAAAAAAAVVTAVGVAVSVAVLCQNLTPFLSRLLSNDSHSNFCCISVLIC